MTLPDTPQAMTLDDATLRRVFPAAPADTSMPRDASSMFRARIRGLPGWVKGGLAAVGVAGALVAIAAPPIGFCIVGAAVLTAAIVAGVQYSRAHKDFYRRYATARGLQLGIGDSASDVPLLRRGDEQKWNHVLNGPIAGQDATLAMYTYTEITTDSEGNRSRTNYEFTLLRFRLPQVVADRFRGVYLAPKRLSFGALQDTFAHDRKVELESADFHKRYSLRVVDEQDDIALYELFSPPFIELLTHQAHVFWEQIGNSLVFYRSGHESEVADLDRFCLEAWHVLQRYLEEHR